jgi:hypothetical protein
MALAFVVRANLETVSWLLVPDLLDGDGMKTFAWTAGIMSTLCVIPILVIPDNAF